MRKQLFSISYPVINPIAFSIGPISIHWYGLAYIAGILSGYYFAIKSNAIIKFKGDISDLVTSILIGLIIGGRLGYVLIYEPSYYLMNPVDIFAIWKGGMAFHGGAIGAALGGIYYCFKHKLSIVTAMDLLAIGVPPGLFFGRIANFINGELYGRETSFAWGMVFPNGGPIARHPSQLYEGFFEGFVLLAFLAICLRFYYAPGRLFSVFVIGYSIFRFLIEFTREPDHQLGLFFNLFSMGQLLSIVMVLLE